MKGTIVKYNKSKGFGFINTPDEENDIFVHITSVLNAKQLEEGQSVTFDIEATPKGKAAVSVKVDGGGKSRFFIYTAVVLVVIVIGFFLLSSL